MQSLFTLLSLSWSMPNFVSHRATLVVDAVWGVGEAAFKVQNGFDYTEGILRLQVWDLRVWWCFRAFSVSQIVEDMWFTPWIAPQGILSLRVPEACGLEACGQGAHNARPLHRRHPKTSEDLQDTIDNDRPNALSTSFNCLMQPGTAGSLHSYLRTFGQSFAGLKLFDSICAWGA